MTIDTNFENSVMKKISDKMSQDFMSKVHINKKEKLSLK